MTSHNVFVCCIVVVVCLLTVLFVGCATVTQTIYLQDTNISGPINQPPIHTTNNAKEHELHITSRFSFTCDRTLEGHIEGHSKVNAWGYFQVDTIHENGTTYLRETPGVNNRTFEGKNLTWNLPSTMFALDLDYTLSNHIAITLGAGYSLVKDEGFWGGNVGLGVYSEDDVFGIRLDGGIQWQSLSYHGATVVVTNTSGPFTSLNSEVVFYDDQGRDLHTDIYGSFTLNTRVQNWFANMFLNLALSKQTFVDYKPSHTKTDYFFGTVITNDARTTSSVTFFMVTPGIYFDLNHSARLLTGIRFALEGEIDESTPDTILMPVVQLDWRL